ncbi:MAG TPA: DUF1697 domain-containing protein [Nocardioidaceae bacterium]
MPTYISLLRAVNVGGRVVRMADLRRCLEQSGLADVETYIQTGNVRFRTAMRSRLKVERHVEQTLATACGFDVPAMLFSPEELGATFEQAMRLPSPFDGSPGHGRYLVFFKEGDVPGPDVAEQIAGWDRPGESAAVLDRAVHLWLDHPTMQSDFFGTFKKALAPGTNRNLTVVRAMVDRWCG